MTFDMRNWHLMGGMQPLGIIRKRRELTIFFASDADLIEDESRAMTDITCRKCGYNECSCTIDVHGNHNHWIIEYDAKFPKVA